MLSPSTAPRWNRHTSTRRERAGRGSDRPAYTARARNSGSSPKLTIASPPALRNARRESCMLPPRGPVAATGAARPNGRRGLLSLELRAPEREPDRERARPPRVGDICDLREDHVSRARAHRAAQDALVDRVDEFLAVAVRRHAVVQVDGRTGQAAGGEREREVHPPEERAAVRPRLLPLRVAGRRRLEVERLPAAARRAPQ